MDLNLKLQRALDQVELVSGSIGNPSRGRMCLMSLVAFLAGEDHSDSPRRASPLIQTYAVRINDHMPYAMRQRLKPFAPRIIGTNDGLDGQRAQVLRQALAEEILCRAPGQYSTEPTAPARGVLPKIRHLWGWLRKDEPHRLLEFTLACDSDLCMANYAARLITRLAQGASDAREQEWYWNAAIGVLDRLCDVGAPLRSEPNIPAERLAQLENTSQLRQDAGGRKEAKAALYLVHW